METCKIDFDAIPWQSPAAGVRQKVVARNSRRLRLVEFAHDFVEADWCLKGHIGYVLEGRMELVMKDRRLLFGPGDGIFIPTGPEHGHKVMVLSDVVRVVLVEDDNGRRD
jgi:ethanolamine utilization protein EutQ (cupin superfamily)